MQLHIVYFDPLVPARLQIQSIEMSKCTCPPVQCPRKHPSITCPWLMLTWSFPYEHLFKWWTILSNDQLPSVYTLHLRMPTFKYKLYFPTGATAPSIRSNWQYPSPSMNFHFPTDTTTWCYTSIHTLYLAIPTLKQAYFTPLSRPQVTAMKWNARSNEKAV